MFKKGGVEQGLLVLVLVLVLVGGFCLRRVGSVLFKKGGVEQGLLVDPGALTKCCRGTR